jgi:hypothetical protein
MTMSDFVTKLASKGHLTPEQIERIGKNVHEFIKAAEANPSLMKEAVEKLAFGWPEMKATAGKIGPPLLTGMALTTAMGVGSGIAHDLYGEIKHGLTKARHYKNMMDKNPQLKNYPAQTVHDAFSTLHKFNPEYASDPMVAGTFVRNAAERERIDVSEIHGLVKARSDSAKARQSGRLFDVSKGPSPFLMNPENPLDH